MTWGRPRKDRVARKPQMQECEDFGLMNSLSPHNDCQTFLHLLACISVMMAFQQALANFMELDRKHEKDLEKREKALVREREAFEKEKKIWGAGDGNVDDVIPLNVGGTRIDVLCGTLTMVEDSFLATKFSGRWDNSIQKDRDGNFFIDQPIDLLGPLIDFLRRRASETEDSPPADPPQKAPSRMMRLGGKTSCVWQNTTMSRTECSSSRSSKSSVTREQPKQKAPFSIRASM